MTDPKAVASELIQRNADAIAQLSDKIFYLGELGMQEHETVRLMTGLLRDAGFKVETGISGFPTGFVATTGEGGPVIALHTEYDSNPDNSQASGATKQEPIVPGAPGHCEGHNCNAAVLVATAIAVKAAKEAVGLPGTLKIFGAPAEELLLARPYYVRDGWFDDVDVAFHDHIAGRLATVAGPQQLAAISADFRFKGETAHAAVSPWNGRDALDAVVLMDMGMAQYREHMKPEMRAHRTITHGGDQPNVVPANASVWWYLRDPTADGARILFDQACRIARGAAMMTNTEVEISVRSATWPVRCNRTLAEIVQRNIDRVGMPQWEESEHTFARDLQSSAGVAVAGLESDPRGLEVRTAPMAASNDCGDVSWKVPMARLWFPSTVPNVNFHHWSGGAALATSIAHKGMVCGAKVLAGAMIDCLADPKLVEQAKTSFAEETGGVTYEPLLPADQRPNPDINRETMERFRERLAAHVPAGDPVFS